MQRAVSPSQERDPNPTSMTWLRAPTLTITLEVIATFLPPFTPTPAPSVSWMMFRVKRMSVASYVSEGATIHSRPVPWPAVKPPVPASYSSLPATRIPADPPFTYIAQSPER